MRGALALVGQLFGTFHRVEGTTMIELIGPILVYQGDDLALCLTVTDDDGVRVDLTTLDAIEVEVKSAPGAADPALIHKDLTDGVTPRDQTADATKGQADVVILSVNTTQTPGLYYLDVVVIVDGVRQHIEGPREFTIAGVVNQV